MPMGDNEQALAGFSTENLFTTVELMVGAYLEASTFQCIIRSRITIKIPPSIDGSTSWFKYEESKTGWTLQCLRKPTVDQH